MRWLIPFVVAGALAACGPGGGKPASTLTQMARSEGRGALWPVMLQHCLRNPGCDPASDFGDGAGEASDMEGEAIWFAATQDTPGTAGADKSGRILISFTGFGGTGGDAGRPLMADEIPSSLSADQQRTTWLTVEYRRQAGKTEPQAFFLRTAVLALSARGPEKEQPQETKAELTGGYIAGLQHGSPDRAGLKIEIIAGRRTVFTGYSTGESAGLRPAKGASAWAFDPWRLQVSGDLRTEAERFAPLMKAIRAGAPLGVRITDPDGRVALETGLGAKGAGAALKAAEAALADPLIATPLAERCKPVVSAEKAAPKSPATPCDDRTMSMRAAEIALRQGRGQLVP